MTAGVVLIVPAALTFTPVLGHFTSDEDVAVAFTPIIRLSLDSLRSGGTIRFSYAVPGSVQWDRIRNNQSMGDHGYIALVADTLHGQAMPFTPLGLELSVSSENKPVSLTPARTGPYLYASSDTRTDVGLRFAAMPGDQLHFAVKALNPERLPEGELIVQRYWEWTAQDFAGVGREIESVLRPFVTRAAQIGLILLGAGVVLRAFKFISGRALSE
jgi:hypothetical protein